ncbi:MAG: mannose-1-phosphate guanylyltransferase [Ignavibacteria bacterium]|nr:MAG: mannose-1-phosphate guanylyltransferase [Ignavibacteria bacterium]
MNLYAVIMAGGIGSRFWPRSKKKTPKQLLKIFGERTMIQETVKRLKGIVKNENIYVITNKIQKTGVLTQLSQLPVENIIEEPFGRNTAACIGLASVLIEKKDPDAVTLVLPADHIINGEKEFHDTLLKAAEFANEARGLVTIGIPPSRPETGYGYIQIDEKPVTEGVFEVLTFAEKPNYATAVRFIESGDFFWNSGMFIQRADVILDEMKLHMPELHEGLIKIQDAIGTKKYMEVLTNVYGRLKKISIDYGIMEKSKKVYLTKGNFKWSDVGSWEAVYELSEKDENNNAKVGQVYTESSVNSFVYSPDKFVALIGVENLIVINNDDSLLICRRDKAQDVKNVIDYLKINELTEYL